MAENKMLGFNDILGNDMIKDHFQKAIENHKVSHAYIINGEKYTSGYFLHASFIICSTNSIRLCSSSSLLTLKFLLSRRIVAWKMSGLPG